MRIIHVIRAIVMPVTDTRISIILQKPNEKFYLFSFLLLFSPFSSFFSLFLSFIYVNK